ncbi:MAG: DUF924 family protein, partial [Sandaracinaceae bacterium]
MNERIQAVLEFWFGEPADGEERPSGVSLWFAEDVGVDRIVEKRFGKWVEEALAGKLDAWGATPKGRLALILLLDQFPRNIHRDTPRAFAGDNKALEICFDGLDEDMHRQLSPLERAFFIRPCMHAEDADAQLAGVEEYQELVNEAPPELVKVCEEFLRHAERKRDIVERFERFPHRNNILGRVSTQEESAVLQ